MKLSEMSRKVLEVLYESKGWVESTSLPRFSAGKIPGDMVPLPAQFIEVKDPKDTEIRMVYGGVTFELRLTPEGRNYVRENIKN